MSPAKVIAFLLGLASLALLLLFGFVAFAGPIMVAPPPPLDKLSEGCLGLVLFASSLPLVAIPGIAGACLWFFVVRKQEAAADAEAVSGLDREASFQNRLDGLTPRLLAHAGDAAALVPEIPLWTRDLDGPRQNRLLRLLAACGGEGPGEIAPPLPAIAVAGTASPPGEPVRSASACSGSPPSASCGGRSSPSPISPPIWVKFSTFLAARRRRPTAPEAASSSLSRRSSEDCRCTG